MIFKIGDKVVVAPLNGKVGRVVAGQSTPRNGVQFYLVRYEVANGTANRYSESSIYFTDELTLAP